MRCLNLETATPSLAANRLARWALLPSQFDYNIEYRGTEYHGNADALSLLPASDDCEFDEEESEGDPQMVCTIAELSSQIAPTGHKALREESTQDSINSKGYFPSELLNSTSL